MALPLSGPHQALGLRVLAAIETAGAGGMRGIRRYDTRGTTADADVAIRKAAADGCTVVIGGVGDREAVAAADAAEETGLPLVIPAGQPDGRERAQVAWVRVPRDEPVRELARRLFSEGVVAAAVVRGDTAYGRQTAESFVAAFGAAGGRILVQQVLGAAAAAEPGRFAGDLAGELSRAPGREECSREALFLAVDLATARHLVPYLEFAGVLGPREDPKCPRPRVAGTALWNVPDVLARTGDALEGAWIADSAPAEGLGIDADAADAARMVDAILSSGRAGGREGIARAFREGFAWSGPTGELRIDAGRVRGRAVQVREVRRGALVVLTTPGDG